MAANEPIRPEPMTLGRLACELHLDRRTLAKAVRDRKADGQINGHPAWFIATALDALARRAEVTGDSRLARFHRTSRSQELPKRHAPWLRAILDASENPHEQGFMLGIMSAIYQCPRIVGGMASQSGVGMNKAFEISRDATFGLISILFGDARRAGIEPFASAGEDGPDIIDVGAFVPLDWRKVAQNAGEPDWRPPMFIPGWPDLDAKD